MWCIRNFHCHGDNFEADTRKPRNRAACCSPIVLMTLCLMWPWPSDLQEGELLNLMFGASMMFVKNTLFLLGQQISYHVQFGDKSCQTTPPPPPHTHCMTSSRRQCLACCCVGEVDQTVLLTEHDMYIILTSHFPYVTTAAACHFTVAWANDIFNLKSTNI